METGNRINRINCILTKSFIKKSLRVLFLFLFSVVLFPQVVHAFNDHVIELNDDYDIQSMELEELEELEESEESEKSSWGNSSKNKHCVLFMKVLLIEPQLFYSSRLLSNQKEIHTPPPEFC